MISEASFDMGYERGYSEADEKWKSFLRGKMPDVWTKVEEYIDKGGKL